VTGGAIARRPSGPEDDDIRTTTMETILVLEDNDERRAAMRSRLLVEYPSVTIRFFTTAAEAIHEIGRWKEEIAVISLDHDLDMIEIDSRRTLDPGSGRDVADYLAAQRPFCSVVIATTNTAAGTGMEQALGESGWWTKRVHPFGDLEWVDEVWAPAMYEAIEYAWSGDNGRSPFVDPKVVQAWDDEIARRMRDFEEGRDRGIPAEEVFAAIRSRLATQQRSRELVDAKLNDLMVLSPAERLVIAERLLNAASSYGSTQTERAWAQEIRRRVRDVEEGRVSGVPAEEFHAELRAEFGLAPE
jgi:putative addiction module component (TIGR02574 family)